MAGPTTHSRQVRLNTKRARSCGLLPVILVNGTASLCSASSPNLSSRGRPVVMANPCITTRLATPRFDRSSYPFPARSPVRPRRTGLLGPGRLAPALQGLGATGPVLAAGLFLAARLATRPAPASQDGEEQDQAGNER